MQEVLLLKCGEHFFCVDRGNGVNAAQLLLAQQLDVTRGNKASLGGNGIDKSRTLQLVIGTLDGAPGDAQITCQLLHRGQLLAGGQSSFFDSGTDCVHNLLINGDIQFRIDFVVDHRHLELVFEVRTGPQALDNDAAAFSLGIYGTFSTGVSSTLTDTRRYTFTVLSITLRLPSRS